MGGGLESRCVDLVYGADVAHGTIRTVRIHQQNYVVASSWYSSLFHEEDSRSNNPQVLSYLLLSKNVRVITYCCCIGV